MPRKAKRRRETQRESGPAPRREPRTPQGREIVEAILTAATEILAEGGLEAMTTNHLAERAGVSIGSLYHYFPNKEAVVAALAERLEERPLAVLAKRRDAARGASKRAVIAALSSTLMSEELGPPAARRALLFDVPRRWVASASAARAAFVHELLSGLFAERSSVRGGDRELMAFVTEHAVRGVIEGALVHRPDLFGAAELEAEIVELVSRYTARDP